MAKVVIANAVVAGATIAQRLTELNVGYDKALFDAVGDLAATLGYLYRGAEILSEASTAVENLITRGETQDALQGINLIKKGLAEMLSEEDSILEALSTKELDAEKEAIEALLKALGAL